MVARISVLINNYNYAAYLAECIDSALGQDYPDLEVVVVDDGSTDGSRDIIAGYGERIVAVLKANGGQASSFNAGFAASSGDVLCLLDADDAFLPGKLTHIAEIYARGGVDWCFDRVSTEPGTTIPAEIKTVDLDRRQALREGGFPTLPVPTSGLTFSRATLAQILPMQTAQDVVLSDNYLKFAAAYLGKGVLVETPLTYQRIHQNNRYTGQSKAKGLRSRIMVATGLELARRYDGLTKMGRSLVAGGLALSDAPIGEFWQQIQACAKEPALSTNALALAGQVAVKKLTSRS